MKRICLALPGAGALPHPRLCEGFIDEICITDMWFIDKLAEARISEAYERGEFDDLPGAGKSLALEDDLHLPEELRVAYRLLKNAGCLPPALQVRKEITELNQLLATIDTSPERTRVIKRLQYLMTQLSLMRGASQDLRCEADYFEKIQQHLQRNPS